MNYKKEYNEAAKEELHPETYGLDKTDEQKPTKWSKEDDAIHTRVLGALGKAFMGVLPTKPSQEDIEWFKSLPERFNLQPKQEWSEEDLQHKSWILEFLADGERKLPSYAADFRAAYNWFNSLCPQPHWKPSEEQMGALEYGIDDLRFCNLGKERLPILQSLLDDLKKL